MRAPVDPAAYGTHAPSGLVRAVLAFTRRLPANWLGFRMSTPFRRLAIDWLTEQPVDTVRVGRAHAALSEPQQLREERAVHAADFRRASNATCWRRPIDASVGQERRFTFLDIGANVGLYSLFVATRGGAQARVLAVEPQPGIVERLQFNVRRNPGFDVTVLPVAVADREGEIDLVIHQRDRAGSYVDGRRPQRRRKGVRVRCRPLIALMQEAGFASIDALKIDIEGAEDLALAPFLRAAPPASAAAPHADRGAARLDARSLRAVEAAGLCGIRAQPAQRDFRLAS